MARKRNLGDPLTEREQEVLIYATSGYTDREISEVLGVSKNSVSQRRGAILNKYGVDKMIELANIELFCPNCGTCLKRKTNDATT